MAFTGVLGSKDASLGHFNLARLDSGPDFDPHVNHTLFLSQLAVCNLHNPSGANTLALTQVATRSMTFDRAISQTLVLTDHGQKVLDNDASSTLSLSQTAVSKNVKNVNVAQTLTITQSATRSLTYNRLSTQGLPMLQSAVRSMYYARLVTQTVTLSQSDTGAASKLAHNTLTLSQNATYVYSHGARNFIELTQLGSRSMTYIKSLHDFFGVFQRLSVNGLYNKAVTQTLSVSQLAVATNTKSVKHTLNITDSAVGITVHATSNALALSQSVILSKTSNIATNSTLTLLQTAPIQKSKAVTAAHAFGMNQFAKGTKVLHVVASNTLTLTQALVQRYFDKNVSQTLTLSQTATAHKHANVSVNSMLSLSQSVTVSKTIVRHLTDTLVFKNSFQKYIGVVNQPYVSVPVAQAVLIKKKCIVTLEALGQSIVLPCPQFGDGEAGTGRLNIKRSMDGTRRVYRRDSPTSKLKYDFIMDRKKAIELRNFVMNNNSTLLRMVNHKGEIWYVLLTNSPFTFTEQAFWDSSWGNKSAITLELEGTRVN